MKCQKILTNNKQCNAFAQKGLKFCFRHDPNKESVALEASRRGGENRQISGVYGLPVILNTPADVKNFLGDVINAVWAEGIPVQVGSSMGFLTRCWLDAHERSDIEKRIDALEKLIDKKG